MNRSVLIVTPFFAPQNHAAVFRAYKLAKYLPQFGWKPLVLTVETQYEFNEDLSLLNALPGDVEIVRARYVEPTFRGIRMALGGRDRSFKSMRDIRQINCTANGVSNTSIGARGYQHAIKNWIHIPDAFWTWAKAAVRTAEVLVRDRMIPVVYTSSSPYSSLRVGRALQRAGAKWVADFRDPLGYSQKTVNYAPRAHAAQRQIVQDALRNADVVTVLASSYSSIFRDVYGDHCNTPVFIPTGVDEMLLPSPEDVQAHKGRYMIFAGEYLSEYDDTFFQAFSQAIKTPEIRQNVPKLLFVGTLEINRKQVMPLAERFGIENHVEFCDQMSQKEAYRLIRHACAGLLIPGRNSFWWTNFAKMTDYIGMRKPVIAVVPDPSEARTALTRSRLGIFLDGPPEQRANTLTDFFLGKYQMAEPDESECERYTARHQVKSFVEIFESLAQQP